MELDSFKDTKFSVVMIRDSQDGTRSASIELKLSADSAGADFDFTHKLDEQATLDLLRAARVWVETHCSGLSEPYTQDTLRVVQTWTERDTDINLDIP